ncbi:hypothetical protein [Actinomycetospora atypica]|uniref:Uncharacterized protein n=1 Tax=Actinomycetospora atypica TaxID=1290095 RepID=A0ABV9YIG0_9PSEU
MLLRIIVIALVVWVVLAVIGFVVKGLLWLAFVALALFVVTAVVGAVRRRSHTV